MISLDLFLDVDGAKADFVGVDSKGNLLSLFLIRMVEYKRFPTVFWIYLLEQEVYSTIIQRFKVLEEIFKKET